MDAEPISPKEVFARELQATRKRKLWTQAQLAERMEELGFEGMDQPMVARSENGKRTVTLDEVLGFALALGVPPMSLVLPRSPEVQVRVALGVARPSKNVAAWWREADPLIDPDVVPRAPSKRFFAEACTDTVAELRKDLPEIVDIYQLSAQLISFGATYQTESMLRLIGMAVDQAIMRLGQKPDRPFSDVLADERSFRQKRDTEQRSKEREN